jgi:hypothetical protein
MPKKPPVSPVYVWEVDTILGRRVEYGIDPNAPMAWGNGDSARAEAARFAANRGRELISLPSAPESRVRAHEMAIEAARTAAIASGYPAPSIPQPAPHPSSSTDPVERAAADLEALAPVVDRALDMTPTVAESAAMDLADQLVQDQLANEATLAAEAMRDEPENVISLEPWDQQRANLAAQLGEALNDADVLDYGDAADEVYAKATAEAAAAAERGPKLEAVPDDPEAKAAAETAAMKAEGHPATLPPIDPEDRPKPPGGSPVPASAPGPVPVPPAGSVDPGPPPMPPPDHEPRPPLTPEERKALMASAWEGHPDAAAALAVSASAAPFEPFEPHPAGSRPAVTDGPGIDRPYTKDELQARAAEVAPVAQRVVRASPWHPQAAVDAAPRAGRGKRPAGKAPAPGAAPSPAKSARDRLFGK